MKFEEKLEIFLSDILMPLIWLLLAVSFSNPPVFFVLLIFLSLLSFVKRKLKYVVEEPKLSGRVKQLQTQGEQVDNVENGLRTGKIEKYGQDISTADKKTAKRIFISDNVRKKLSRLDKKTKEKFDRVVRGLLGEWTPLVNISKLKGFNDMFIFRLGNYRMIYEIENDKIIILDFFERRDLGLREHGLLQKLLSLRGK